MDTNNLITIVKGVPSLKAVPDKMIIAGLVIFIAVFLFFSVLLILSTIGGTRKPEKKQENPPDSHKLILDLQKTLISEMKGTSKQNELMIRLTVMFIVITIIGMFISILGAQFFMDLFKGLMHTTGSAKIPGR